MVERDEAGRVIIPNKGSGARRVFEFQKERLANEMMGIEDKEMSHKERIRMIFDAAQHTRRIEGS